MNESEKQPNDIDRLGYAVSFWEAARRLIEHDYRGPEPLLAPEMMLLCSAIENGLKAILEHAVHEPRRSWFRTHSLRNLRLMAADHGLSLSGSSSGIIDRVSPYHEQHLFRYSLVIPGNLPSAKKVETACDELLVASGRLIGVHERLGDVKPS